MVPDENLVRKEILSAHRGDLQERERSHGQRIDARVVQGRSGRDREGQERGVRDTRTDTRLRV